MLDILKQETQTIIDLMAKKDWNSAVELLNQVNEKVDDYLDTVSDDEDLIELSKYQVLLNHLSIKISKKEF